MTESSAYNKKVIQFYCWYWHLHCPACKDIINIRNWSVLIHGIRMSLEEHLIFFPYTAHILVKIPYLTIIHRQNGTNDDKYDSDVRITIGHAAGIQFY